MYNQSKYFLKRYSKYNSIFINYIYHFNSEYKHLDIIKDNYLDKTDDFQKNILLYYKKNIYDVNFKKINKLLNSIKIKQNAGGSIL